MSRKITNQMLAEAVVACSSYREVARYLGYTKFGGGTMNNISSRIKSLDLNTSHFEHPHTHLTSQGWNKKSSSDVLVNRVGSKVRQTAATLRRALSDIGVPYKCYRCNRNKWEGETLSLHVDHIDGNYTNDTRENLRLACPNCHSLTPNFSKQKCVISLSELKILLDSHTYSEVSNMLNLTESTIRKRIRNSVKD